MISAVCRPASVVGASAAEAGLLAAVADDVNRFKAGRVVERERPVDERDLRRRHGGVGDVVGRRDFADDARLATSPEVVTAGERSMTHCPHRVVVIDVDGPETERAAPRKLGMVCTSMGGRGRR